MKKVIFLAIAAAAALTACSKSEVIDSKYGNDMIGFENYLGRDAQTKASVADINVLKTSDYAGIGLFGYYTGKDSWKYDETVTEGINPTANLWANQLLKWGVPTNTVLGTEATWTYSDIRYWTNTVDKYSFLAYAPYATNDNGIAVGTDTDANDLTITYACPIAQGGNVDLLYSNNNKNITKGSGTVGLNFQHALARVTVKARASGDAFGYDIKEISLTGGFIKENTLKLATGTWASNDPIAEKSTYIIYNDHAPSKSVTDGNVTWDVLGTDYYDYSGTTVTTVEGTTTTTYGDNFLMMIPTNFTTTHATLKIVYTTIYAEQESAEITKEIDITNDFAQGMAYSLNIDFSPVLDPIKFSVTVTDWNNATDTNTGNPESSTAGWAEPNTTPENGEAGA